MKIFMDNLILKPYLNDLLIIKKQTNVVTREYVFDAKKL